MAQLTTEQKELLKTIAKDDALLKRLLACEDLDEIKTHCPTLYQIATQYHTPNYSLTGAFIDLANHIGAFVLTMDAFFTLITAISLITFFIFGAVFTAVLAISGAIYLAGAYKELKQQHHEQNKKDQLLALKTLCLAEHSEKILEEANEKKLAALLDHFNEKSTQKIPSAEKWRGRKEAVYAFALTGGTTFYTYYAFTLGLSVVLSGSLLVGALTGPIGLGIALTVALSIGVFLGYKKYQAVKSEARLELRRKSLQETYDRFAGDRSLKRSKTTRHAPSSRAVNHAPLYRIGCHTYYAGSKRTTHLPRRPARP